MHRRRLTLSLALVAAAFVALAACAVGHPASASAPLPSAADVAAREQTADEQVRHALDRVAFGARPGDYERVRAMGVDRWIALQLTPDKVEDGATDRFIAQFRVVGMSTAQALAEFPPPQQVQAALKGGKNGTPTAADSMDLKRMAQQSRRVLVELQTAKVGRALISQRQLQEVMVDFWENHFNVFAGKGPERYMLAAYERDAIRPYAMGRFRDLLEAVAKSPAMLFYLDNWESTVEPDRPALAGNRARLVAARRALRTPINDTLQKRRPRGLNENYGRELLELHTLGVDGGYTQQDVINVARAFTGWTVDRPRQGGGFIFRPAMHDAGPKVVLGHSLASDRGMEDGEQVLDIVAHHPATARYIATKLVRRFVGDSVPPALVARVAATFTRTDGDIRECLRTILVSDEFFSRDAYRSKVKSPFELVVSALRAMDAEPDTTPRTAQIIARLGQPLYGHQAPNGYPEVGSAWINTGAIINRINFGLAVAGGRVPGVSLSLWAEGEGLEDGDRDADVDGVVKAILGGEASPDTRKVLESGENPLLATASEEDTLAEMALSDSMAPPLDTVTTPMVSVPGVKAGKKGARRQADPLGRPAELDGLALVVGLALGAPEFQRR
ncbi:MAG TPA: DUF1800 domain-containing protein [Gemmatimonadaceae bacterium]|nr:DUF1800 domain-containing protein [Gemmatimonadaceae bacterium]